MIEDTLPEKARPFAAAILLMEQPLPPAVAAELRADQVSEVHRAFAAYLVALSLGEMPGAADVAAKYLAVVTAAGAAADGWNALAWIRAGRIAAKAISAAMAGGAVH